MKRLIVRTTDGYIILNVLVDVTGEDYSINFNFPIVCALSSISLKELPKTKEQDPTHD